MPPDLPFTNTRRGALRSLLGGSLVFPGLLSELLADGGSHPRSAHFPPAAKRVIWIYLSGGFSHVDTFDPKPAIQKKATLPGAQDSKKKNRYLPSPWAFHQHGQSGTEISELFPHIASCADDLCVIRSLHGNHSNHVQATLGMHTGSFSVARPSIGSWVSYGLGSPNRNLPSFVVLAPHTPYGGTLPWGANFLPKQHQGTRIIPSAEPVPHLRRRSPTPLTQQLERQLLHDHNHNHLQTHPGAPTLTARIRAFETAFGMQMEMPQVLDFRSESDATHRLYGLGRGQTDNFAWQCLAARRLAEAGVRFIELIDTGSNRNWDSHTDIHHHTPLARNIDQPVAALLKDLKSRGMLDETLVVFTTEFGRTPTLEGTYRGRGHHNRVFSSWLSGGGTRPGTVYGTSDTLGERVETDPVHVHDFHATILHLLGFDHTRLTYRHAGRDFRLTDVHGKVIHGLLG